MEDVLSRLYLIDEAESVESLSKSLCDSLLLEISFLERQLRVQDRKDVLHHKIEQTIILNGNDDNNDDIADLEEKNNKPNDSQSIFTEVEKSDVHNSIHNLNFNLQEETTKSHMPLLDTMTSGNTFQDTNNNNNNIDHSISLPESSLDDIFHHSGHPSIDQLLDNNEESCCPMCQEEICWEINFCHATKVFDSKLFLFAGIYWNVSFGINDENSKFRDFYYLHLSPAQVLFREARLMCEFRIYQDSNIVFSRKSSQDLIFMPHNDINNNHSSSNRNGLDRFIDSNEIYEYVDERAGKLQLSIVVSTDIGPMGELIGCYSLS
mmetsp:Transcript_29304/g.41792  ORF Transcript_29304/g.41792 Transcript_29304/m.41792 type:complete len:321 (-) Transcript_29304:195-1157(-)|eukprot:CAMPEP_0170084956 /NCGR_PEP_ID=MMETSP0019_2-20121128/19980_1 /TAXON_ID=98059 /ORGANISM="Dinobryon sp., Strain UTEXLB2267" /LENGTH=320 /DNA_ID=CAMNT_0010301217 /DNA_START=930 /DNA_END=1892 /DNA_ORIENTATION=-